MPAQHLLAVWNPSYSDDALQQHLEILLRFAGAARSGEAEADEVYVWWAKIRSRNREGRLPHHADVVGLDRQIQAGVETHLYLTDYRSLYVAEVGEVTDDDVRRDAGEPAHIAPYTREHAVDFWFRLFDIRLLVSDDTPAVIGELRRLRNRRYHDRPVSLYGGMVELPLIVVRDPEVSWFTDRAELAEGRLWAEHATAHRSAAAAMFAELRDNLIGRELWPWLAPATRTFLASAEAVFRAHRDDLGFDLSGAAVEYAKAVEVELNDLVFGALRRRASSLKPGERVVQRAGRRLDLAGTPVHQTLGVLCALLKEEPVVQKGLRQALPHDCRWLLGELPGSLSRLVDLRNRGAHRTSVSGGELAAIRRQVMGVGLEGMIPRLLRAKARGAPAGGR